MGILSGKRPERPAHPGLTDELWGLIQQCWDQEPQLRPGISEVVTCLQAALAAQEDHGGGTGIPTTDCTVSINSRQIEPPHRMSFLLTFCVVVSQDRQVYAANRRLHAGFQRFVSFPDHFPDVRPRSTSLSGWEVGSGKHRPAYGTLPPAHPVFCEEQPFGFSILRSGLDRIVTVASIAIRRDTVRKGSGCRSLISSSQCCRCRSGVKGPTVECL